MRKAFGLALITAAFGIAAEGPVSFSAAAQRGVQLAGTGQCPEALPLLRKAQGHVEDADLKRSLGTAGVKCALAVNQQDDALRFIQALNHEFPHDPEILYLTTHVFSDLSIRASQELLYSAPASPQVHQLNAEALETQGKWKEAEYEYKAVLEKDPRMAGIHYRIGRLILSQPKTDTTFADARKEFEAELAVDPKNAGAEYVLGEIARQSEEWPNAIDHFSRAVKLDVHFADAFLGLGRALTAADKPAEAIAPLETAVRLQPDNPAAHFYLATAYRHAGRREDADRELAVHKKKSDEAAARREHLHESLAGPQQAQPTQQ
ncbi:MAG TPA: tetratricopeptide repeat protein [Bryobacteraceae bacterium]|nr:tetratricopeptide repeat protein [Bryobacteraceae bacterium]